MTTATASSTFPIDDIETGERFRKDLGDLAPLEASIEELGLLQPIGLTKDGRLLYGARRLKAAKNLGWTEVPYTIPENVADAARELLAERDENICRKDMKPSEAARLGIAIEALDADQRYRNRVYNLGLSSKRKGDGNLPVPSDYKPLGSAREAVAPALGMSGVTYDRAKKVVLAAEDENPKVRQAGREALEEMDRTGKVSGSFEKVIRVKNAQPEPGQFAKWDKTSARYKSKVAKILEGTWGSLNRFDVAAPELAAMDMEVLIDNLSPEELEAMYEMAGNAVTGLKAFQRRLKENKPEES